MVLVVVWQEGGAVTAASSRRAPSGQVPHAVLLAGAARRGSECRRRSCRRRDACQEHPVTPGGNAASPSPSRACQQHIDLTPAAVISRRGDRVRQEREGRWWVLWRE